MYIFLEKLLFLFEFLCLYVRGSIRKTEKRRFWTWRISVYCID